MGRGLCKTCRLREAHSDTRSGRRLRRGPRRAQLPAREPVSVPAARRSSEPSSDPASGLRRQQLKNPPLGRRPPTSVQAHGCRGGGRAASLSPAQVRTTIALAPNIDACTHTRTQMHTHTSGGVVALVLAPGAGHPPFCLDMGCLSSPMANSHLHR
ncbi:hippocalcin-like protein 4 isoform X2 [Macaca thibetana thibetana]|uniref:hippocalcin-like protein 4 isoform X2 n=1 Tax=Macaca thibetana thibetana TaxID=257877 RepID=UPI0021BC63FC|nr:hippocalcin-like protein 4 isoform X2 [Macaca thibetana thibetana]